ncbi:flagellar biosynthesis anti-sigma factor FlgM [candidate division KSB1 bacterium]|nr:flagellar biosynthesis anti-sigma factor FlgM [candidate division KSB1 bacterium]
MTNQNRQSLYEKLLKIIREKQIDLTDEEINKIVDAYMNLPDVRTEKVARLKALIESGQYKIEAEQLADAILAHRKDIAGLAH